MKKLPVFPDRMEGLPAKLAERYTSTSKEVQDKLRDNVSLLISQTAATAAALMINLRGAINFRTRPTSHTCTVVWQCMHQSLLSTQGLACVRCSSHCCQVCACRPQTLRQV